MKKSSFKKEIAFERVLFFGDAIVAIAITILALNLKLDVPATEDLTFTDLVLPWKSILAFTLSFINIAGFWKTHHDFFAYIHKMDDRLLTLHIMWLFFIVTLPFSTTVLSLHFSNSPAIFLYSLNILLITLVQFFISEYAMMRENFSNEDSISDEVRKRFQIMCQLDIINGVIAVVLSFFFPVLAFILLFTKVPIFVIATIYMARQRRKKTTTRR